MGTGLVRAGDAEVLLAVLDEARHDDPGPIVPWALLEGLQRLLACDQDVSYQRYDHRRGQALLLQSVAADGTREVVRSGPEGPAEPWARLLGRPPGDAREVVVPVPAPPGEVRRFLFVRSSGPPFDAADRRLLELLRPHLHEVWQDAERRRAGALPLSPREWEVLGLAGTGASTVEIADALWISVGTVRKHMEHIREKLGVHTIAAAAARALPFAPGGSDAG
ncbi:helix-turn-helix transcriptional regulator [Blastococcus sp. SYSU D01042]